MSESPMTAISVRAYFAANTIDNNTLSSAAKEVFQSLASSHGTNITKYNLKAQKFHSVEEAVYEVLFNKTTIEISSQSSCPLSTWIVSTDCVLLTLSPEVSFYKNDYFLQHGQGSFLKLLDYHTSTAFTSQENSLEEFKSNLMSSQEFNSLADIRSDVIFPEEVMFEDQFRPVMDPRIYYDTKKENAFITMFITMARRPISLFFYSSIGFLIGVMFLIWNDRRYEERNKLLESHFNTVSRAMLEIPSYEEGEESVQGNGTDSDDQSSSKVSESAESYAADKSEAF